MKTTRPNSHSSRPRSRGPAATSRTFTGATLRAILSLLLLGSGLLAPTASAVIAVVDKPTSAFSYNFTGTSGTQTKDEPVTVSAGVSTLVVMLGWRNDPGVSEVNNWSFSYNGAALTKAVNIGSTAGTFVGAAIYYLHDPTPGTHTLEAIFTAGTTSRNMAVVSYMTLSGVDTTAGVVAGGNNPASPNSSGETPITRSVSLASPAFGSIAVANWGIRSANNSEAPRTYTYSANSGAQPGSQVTYGVMTPPFNRGADDGAFLHSTAGYVPTLPEGTCEISVSGVSTDGRNGLAVAIFAPVVVTSYTISGKIGCSDAADAAGAVVALKQDGNVVSSATVPSGGAYSFTVLNGTYTIAASKNFYTPNESEPITVSGDNVVQDLTLTRLPVCVVSGTVRDGLAGVGDVVVTATYAGGGASATSSGVDGSYSLEVPATLPVTLSASSIPLSKLLVSVPAPFTAPDATPIIDKDVELSPNPEYDADLVFSARSNAIPSAGAAWPCAFPPGANLGILGSPSLATVHGQQMESNRFATADCYRLGIFSFTTIPCNGAGGASIVAVVQPIYQAGAGTQSAVLNCFYDSLGLDVVAGTGLVRGLVNGRWSHGPIIPDGQLSVVSMVVQPDASVMFYVNGAGTAGVYDSGPTVTSYTQITDGGTAGLANCHYIDIGRTDAETTTAFNGNLGDVFLYNAAISDAKRSAQETALAAKFGIVGVAATPATDVTDAGATLNGDLTLTTDPATTALTFHYGTTDPGNTLVGWDHSVSLAAPNNMGAFSTPVSGLSNSTPYYYRIHWTHTTGEGWAGPVTFTTLAGNQTAFELWASGPEGYGLTGTDAEMGADPDKDGSNNLMEFAFNGVPNDGSKNGMFFTETKDNDADTLKELTFTCAVRRSTAVTFATNVDGAQSATIDGVIYTIEGSGNLTEVWTSPVAYIGKSDAPPAGSGLDSLAGTAWEYCTFSAFNGLPDKGFLRARSAPAP